MQKLKSQPAPDLKQAAKLMDKHIGQFQKRISKNKIQVCDLGSCQYDMASATYHFALGALKISRPLFEQLFQIKYTKEYTLPEFLSFLQGILDEEWESFKDDEDWMAVNRKKPVIKSIEDYYEWCKDNAWDLWSAAESPLESMEHTELELPAFGPILNVMVQGDNWHTGLYIAYTTFLFGTDIAAFADFDT